MMLLCNQTDILLALSATTHRVKEESDYGCY
jgi:hypothetical protein